MHSVLKCTNLAKNEAFALSSKTIKRNDKMLPKLIELLGLTVFFILQENLGVQRSKQATEVNKAMELCVRFILQL